MCRKSTTAFRLREEDTGCFVFIFDTGFGLALQVQMSTAYEPQAFIIAYRWHLLHVRCMYERTSWLLISCYLIFCCFTQLWVHVKPWLDAVHRLDENVNEEMACEPTLPV